MADMVPDFVINVLSVLAVLFVVAIGVGLLAVLILYAVDVTQSRHAIRRNYPVIGRFRYFFEHLGSFFRQYFFAMDREEMPFNREQRSYVYRAAKNVSTRHAFGSTRDLRPPGTVYFVNCPFPTLEEDVVENAPLTIGPTAAKPYVTDALFNISGMSYGAISKAAVQALSAGAAEAGIWVNTGEGGLSPFHLEGGCDIVFQLGTAKYGIRDRDGRLSDERIQALAAHEQVRMFEIKLSQGAKPGKGGILPAAKVSQEIAEIRGISVGQSSLSPNRHPDIGCVGDLLDMLERIRRVSGKPVGFKCVVGAYGWLEELFEEVHRRGLDSAPDFITVDSADGGTGAAPMALMDHMGLPIWESLPMVADRLQGYGLKERTRLIASGKLITPADVAWALCAGADFVVSARGFMFALGCIQAMQCNKNTCPTGITTQDARLQRGLVPADKAERVANYARHVVKEVGVIAHSCGAADPRGLRRFHARQVIAEGGSVPLDQLYPEVAPGSLIGRGGGITSVPGQDAPPPGLLQAGETR